jgi:hypothetical protein
MRMVVDSNVLQTSSLREFLSKARTNKAVITDYLMIEALKGDPLGKIFGLMKILCEFPKQVIVLKGLRSISALKGRRSGMTRRMIEKGQTRGYENWCAPSKAMLASTSGSLWTGAAIASNLNDRAAVTKEGR